MDGIKYYHLAKDEELPDEFCAVRDVGGEPSEYTFYVPESEVAKLRELVRDVWHLFTEHGAVHPCDLPVVDAVRDRMHELEIEVKDE